MAIWKKDKDEDQPVVGSRPVERRESAPQTATSQPTAAVETPPLTGSGTQGVRRDMKEETTMANIGKSISIKGDVLGEEDTVVEGRVEGRVSLKNHHLTIGGNGDVQGEVSAKQITIVGKVSGNVIASERVEVRDSGRVEGDVLAPRLLVTEGAIINGAITMKDVGSIKTPQPQVNKDASGQNYSGQKPQHGPNRD